MSHKNVPKRASQKSARKPRVAQRVEAAIPESFSLTNPAVGSSAFWPQHKASALVAGNVIEAAGQENFVTDFSAVRETYDVRTRFKVLADMPAKRTPNAMRIDVQTYFGATANSGYSTSAINQAVLFIKQFIDTNLGSQQSYDPQDLAPYFMAVADCFTLTAEIKRNLRLLVMEMIQWPYFIPHSMFDLLEICSPAEKPDMATSSEPKPGSGARYYRQQLRPMVDRLNQLINLLNSLPVPLEMQLFGYNDDLYSAIFADTEDLPTAQQYVFASTGTWIYQDDSETDEEDAGSRVIFHEWPKNPEGKRWKTLDEMLDRLEEMILAISAYRTNSTALIQNLRNAYGTQRLRTVAPLDINNLVPLQIVYDGLMLISIENISLQDQVWPSGFVASAEFTSLRGTPYLVDHDDQTMVQKYGMINLPLQFHCHRDQITQEMIGRALRFHPAFQTRELTRIYTASAPDGYEERVITPGGCFGFAIAVRLTVGYVGDDGNLAVKTIYNRADAAKDPQLVMMMGDFAHSPALIWCQHLKDDANGERLVLVAYSAKRDTELTLRYDEMVQWWVGLTEIAWGTNVSHDIRGARAII